MKLSHQLAVVCLTAVLVLPNPQVLALDTGKLTDITAQKGTAKLSLKLRGWISTGIMVWDDGVEANAYVVDNGEQNSRVALSGVARITPRVRAGFEVELGLSGNFPGTGGIPSSNCVDQVTTDCGPQPLIVRTTEVWTAHNHVGRLALGLGSPPSRLVKNFAGRVAGTSFWGMDSSPQVGMHMLVRRKDGKLSRLRWRHIIDGRVGPFREQLTWTLPKIAGLSISAGVGTDDHWDAAAYYTIANAAGFKVYGALGYIDDRTPPAGLEFAELKGSLGVMHLQSGLYAWFAAANRDYYRISGVDNPGGADWYVQTGLKRSLVGWGPTALSVDFGIHSNIRAGLFIPGTKETIRSSAAQFFGVGLTQWLDKASSEIYLGWRRYDAVRLTTDGTNGEELRGLDAVMVGARVKF